MNLSQQLIRFQENVITSSLNITTASFFHCAALILVWFGLVVVDYRSPTPPVLTMVNI